MVAALISCNWDPYEAFMILAKEMMEPTVYKYIIKNRVEKQGFKHIETDRVRSAQLLTNIKVTTLRSKREEKK